jgi:DNA replication protein
MKQYGGFPSKMQFTAIPEPFFSRILPEIDDIAELKTLLSVFRLVYRKKGRLRFVTLSELKDDVALVQGIAVEGVIPASRLETALETAVERGVLLHLAAETNGASEGVYFLNTEADRVLVARLRSGEMVFPALKVNPSTEYEAKVEMPDIFSFYEQNIGVITPIIVEGLRDAQKQYPEAWIGDAIREAANHGKRNWSYISAILERWNAEGRVDGTHRGNPKTDPDKYIKGKYGHLVQR